MYSYLREQGLDAFIVAAPVNWAYLTGFTGSSGLLLLNQERAVLLTDARYVEQAKEEAPGVEVRRSSREPVQDLARILRSWGAREVGFEADHLTVKRFRAWERELPEVSWREGNGVVEALRAIKEEEELALIRQAIAIAEGALREVFPLLVEGRSESELALELEFSLRRRGAEAPAFTTIVASGPRGALPHGVASQRRLKRGDLITIDCGALYRGYASDLTRTFALGEVDARQKEIYELVRLAQQEGIRAIRPGRPAREVDAAARRVIEESGLGEYFGHGLGHGVGREVHEQPVVGPSSEEVLRPGMIITVEPGIYIPEWGGVRIEDMALVTENGCEVLTGFTRELLLL